MDEFADGMSPVQATNLLVTLDQLTSVASLRHFGADGDFARAVQDVTGLRFPKVLGIASRPSLGQGDRVMWAWRSPTEIVMLCDDNSLIKRLEGDTCLLDDGCVVDLSGAAWIVRARGPGVGDLMARMGGQNTMPRLGQACRSRLADIPVMAMQVDPVETLLLVERVYAEHLWGWIRISTSVIARGEMRLSDTCDFRENLEKTHINY